MTDLLLAYLCVGMTLVGVYCVREWRNASSYRSYVKPLFTDIQEANLLLLEAELPEKADHVVTSRGGEDHAGDEQDLEPDLFHGLIMRNGADG